MNDNGYQYSEHCADQVEAGYFKPIDNSWENDQRIAALKAEAKQIAHVFYGSKESEAEAAGRIQEIEKELLIRGGGSLPAHTAGLDDRPYSAKYRAIFSQLDS